MSYGLKKPVHDVRTIAEVEGGVVKPGKEAEWKEQIIVPPLPQSSLAGCELIKIDYYVKVRASLLRCLLILMTVMLMDILKYGGQYWLSASSSKTECLLPGFCRNHMKLVSFSPFMLLLISSVYL